MKKGWKIFWIICGVAVSIGIVCCMTAGILGVNFADVEDIFVFHLDDGASVTSKIQDHHEYEYGEYAEHADTGETYSGIEAIDVEAAGIQLQILPSEDEDVHVETTGVDRRLKYSCRQDGRTLEITTTKKLRVINRIKGYATVWIYLPDRQLQEIDLSNDAGEVYVKMADAREFTVAVGAGEAKIDDFTAVEADLDCGAGTITAEGTILGEGDISCGIGEISLLLSGREEDYSYDVECGIGAVTVGGRELGGIGIDHSDHSEHSDHSSHSEEHGYSGSRELSIECGIGSVDIDFKG